MTPSQIQAAAARFANSGPGEGHMGRPVEGTMMHTESLSPSPSEGTVQTDTDVTLNGSFPDLFTTIGSGNFAPEYQYGMFPGFDYFSGDYYVPEMTSVNYGEENTDGLIVDESFLWNF